MKMQPIPSNGFWGKHGWRILETLARTYTPDMGDAYNSLLISLTELLPCEVCCKHLGEALYVMPLSGNYAVWIYKLHDRVNHSIGRKSPPFDSVQSLYRNCRMPAFYEDSLWVLLHSICIKYSPKHKNAMIRFYNSIVTLLPGMTSLRTVPLTQQHLNTNMSLFLWSYQVHELHNKNTGRMMQPYSVLKATYIKHVGECSECKINH